MNAFELDFWMQVAKVRPPCRSMRSEDDSCEHDLDDHDLNDPEGPCTKCACQKYRPTLCRGERTGPCSKVLGHDGPHYFYRP